MAVLARCFFCPPWHATGIGACRPHSEAGRSPLPSREEKLSVLFFGAQRKMQILSRISRHSTSTETELHVSITETTHGSGSKPFVFCQPVSDHKIMTLPALPKTLFLCNALMLVLPPEAFAETCEPAVPNMPILFTIAFIGATVGGLLARQRKGELKRLNEQLRQINAALRRQAKIESYAPNLSYVPVNQVCEAEVIIDPRKEELLSKLRVGKNYLRNHDSEKAFTEFNGAFELAENIGDHIEEKKAARGLGASLQRQGKYREAIKWHSKVLEIATRYGDVSGSTEAYGAIADCYTELGDLERAGKFYDKYITTLETD